MTTVKDVVNRIEKFSPKHLAEEWDPIGLAFGSMDKSVKKLMVALDLDADTLEEAKEKDVDLMVTHHPPIFGKLSTLNEENERRKQYIDFIRSDIALYAAHTNLDAADGGINDWLADAIGLKQDREIVETTYEEKYKKIVVYVPKYDSKELRRALHEVGAGELGNYKDVSYTLNGYGRFTPQKGANPAEGKVAKSETVEEERIEMMLPERLINSVIQAIYKNHPYEEPVFDFYHLGKTNKAFGYGRIGKLETTTEELAERIKNIFDRSHVRFVSRDSQKKQKKVAIFGGAGEKYYQSALAKGADIYITGDVSYHGAQDMLREGLDVIDPGHYIESIVVPQMVELLEEWKQKEEWTIDILPSTAQKDIFQFI